LQFNWEGGLSDMNQTFSSVALQKKHWNGVDVSTGYQYFLEILLQQEKSAACKAFIQKHLEHI
jgi:hypothetical protein